MSVRLGNPSISDSCLTGRGLRTKRAQAEDRSERGLGDKAGSGHGNGTTYLAKFGQIPVEFREDLDPGLGHVQVLGS